MNEFRVEEWTERECELLNEMKDRCLNGGKYKDEKAKEKFEMICHLEDYCVQYYQLLDYINQLENKYNKALELLVYFNLPCERQMFMDRYSEWCELNCSVSDECYKKCWNKYIEAELEKSKSE